MWDIYLQGAQVGISLLRGLLFLGAIFGSLYWGAILMVGHVEAGPSYPGICLKGMCYLWDIWDQAHHIQA